MFKKIYCYVLNTFGIDVLLCKKEDKEPNIAYKLEPENIKVKEDIVLLDVENKTTESEELEKNIKTKSKKVSRQNKTKQKGDAPKRHWYNNGVNQKLMSPNDPDTKHWVKGRLNNTKGL